MGRCSRCGTILPEEAEYCFMCGSPVSQVVTEEFSISSDDLVKKVKDLVHEGNVTRIVVRDDRNRILLEMPTTAGLIGAVLAPWLAALGALAALATQCKVSVERRE